MQRTVGRHIRKSRSDRVFDVCNVAFMLVFSFLMIYPLYFTVIASISDPYEVINGRVYIAPVGLTLEVYQNVFKEDRIWMGYLNTIKYTAFGTLFNLLLTIPAAYTLSKKHVLGRRAMSMYFLIPMYFGGGLVPTYLQVKALGLMNTPYTLILLGGVSMYNLIVTRVFFSTSIPEALYESAKIDGASELRIFWRIVLPLAKPIIAVMALFYSVSHWNSYFNALIYISRDEYQPLQIVLRNILLSNQMSLAILGTDNLEAEVVQAAARRQYLAQGMKYALIFISSAPLLIAYPFVQKHFVKGVMIGSVKG